MKFGKKTILFGIFILIVTLTRVFFLQETTRWPFGELASIQRKIDNQVEATLLTGEKGEVFFKSSSQALLLLSPPYASLAKIADKITPSLQTEMEAEVNRIETGHVFLIEDGRIIDHRLLSGSAEPLIGSAEGTEFTFLISREEISGRPVRIELLKK